MNTKTKEKHWNYVKLRRQKKLYQVYQYNRIFLLF